MNGTHVYNVAMPLLKRCYPDQPAFRLIELAMASDTDAGIAASGAVT